MRGVVVKIQALERVRGRYGYTALLSGLDLALEAS